MSGELDLGTRRGRVGWFTAAFVALSLAGAGTFAVAELDQPLQCPEPDSPLAPEAWPEGCPRPEAQTAVAVAPQTPAPAEEPTPAAESPADEDATAADEAATPAAEPAPQPEPAREPDALADDPATAAAAVVDAATDVTDPDLPADGSAVADGAAPPQDPVDPAPAGDATTTPDATLPDVPTTPGDGDLPVAPDTPDTPDAPVVDPGELPAAPVDPAAPVLVDPTLPPATVSASGEAPVDAPLPTAEDLLALADQVLASGAGQALTPAKATRPARGDSRPTTVPAREEADHDEGHDHDAPAGMSFPAVDVDWSSLTPLSPPDFASDEAARFPGPAVLLPIYQAAGAEYDIPWQVLASINEIETNYGRNQGPSSAGAVGWMQFMPATWQAYGVDANDDGVRNPADPVDAIFAAANYLDASGGREKLAKAVFAYNHAGWYVDRVLKRAIEFGRIHPDLLAALEHEGRQDAKAIRRVTGARGYLDPDAEIDGLGRTLLLDDEALRKHVLANERITVYPCGRGDIADGVVDRRVLTLLEVLADRKLRPTVSSLRCGHGYLTASGNVSDHSHGGAVDIAAINGTSILGNQGPGSITDDAIQELLKLQGGLRPTQIISLMRYADASNTVALGDHHDHIHVGFPALRGIDNDR